MSKDDSAHQDATHTAMPVEAGRVPRKRLTDIDAARDGADRADRYPFPARENGVAMQVLLTFALGLAINSLMPEDPPAFNVLSSLLRHPLRAEHPLSVPARPDAVPQRCWFRGGRPDPDRAGAPGTRGDHGLSHRWSSGGRRLGGSRSPLSRSWPQARRRSWPPGPPCSTARRGCRPRPQLLTGGRRARWNRQAGLGTTLGRAEPSSAGRGAVSSPGLRRTPGWVRPSRDGGAWPWCAG